MRKHAAIVILLTFILNPFALHAEEKGFLDGFFESIAKITGFMTINQALLYGVVAGYHSKFNKWPANKEEMIADLSNSSVDTKKALGRDPVNLLLSMDVTFKEMGDGMLLIEAKYSDEVEKKFEQIGLGKFRISAIASCSKEDYVFTPSKETTNNRDYFTTPAKVRRPVAKNGNP